MIFINLNKNEIEFEEYIKPLSDRWEKFWPVKDRELMVHSNDYGYFNLNANCNWKFAIENYCESYHLPWVHPGLNSYSKLKIITIYKGYQIALLDKERKSIIQDLKVKKNFHVFLIGPKIKNILQNMLRYFQM